MGKYEIKNDCKIQYLWYILWYYYCSTSHLHKHCLSSAAARRHTYLGAAFMDCTHHKYRWAWEATPNINCSCYLLIYCYYNHDLTISNVRHQLPGIIIMILSKRRLLSSFGCSQRLVRCCIRLCQSSRTKVNCGIGIVTRKINIAAGCRRRDNVIVYCRPH